MIISFTVENWASFRDPASLSMVATRERQHSDRLAKLKKYSTRLLPISVIYGGNASGKTNLFQALAFVRHFVVQGTAVDGYIPINEFKLGRLNAKTPTRFAFELLVNEKIYDFSFVVDSRHVIEERLIAVKASSEDLLYERFADGMTFGKSLLADQFLEFAFKGTRENQLFLTNATSQKVERFRDLFDWFKDTLELVAPDTRFEPFEQFLENGHPLFEKMEGLLPLLDTGISRLGGEELPFDSLSIPAGVKEQLQSQIKEGEAVRLSIDKDERIIVARQNGQLVSKKLVAYHKDAEGREIKFDMHHESDGTKRIIDLLPAFLELGEKASQRVYVVDEIDRSLHSLLTRRLIEAFLEACSADTRSQLLVTTHDVMLMDQKLLRRDEMWVAERHSDGASSLISFAEYKDVRNDKDIRKSYLQGRMGGVPRISFGSDLTESTSDLGERLA